VTAVRASAALVAARPPEGGPTRCTTLRSAPPLTLRATGDDNVHLVGSAAGPVGGDDLRLSVTLCAKGRLTVRSVAASIVLPGPVGAPSSLDLDVDVGPAAALRWLPEPTILVRGCDHRTTNRIRLAAGAELVWREVVVLGRHDEEPGSLLQRLRVDVDGRPLLRTDLAVGPLWPGSRGPAGVGDARAVATAVVVGPEAASLRAMSGDAVRAAVLPLDDWAVLLTVLSPHPAAAIAALDAALTPA
jgi:urease accessory protein